MSEQQPSVQTASPAAGPEQGRFTILCMRCERQVIARDGWIGREVQCPHCSSVIRVPPRPAIDVPIRSDPPNLSAKKCFNFACPRCDCLLEAHTGMCNQHGSCPTCGARFVVPYLSRVGGRPEKAKLLEGTIEAPMPVHAYAASGEQAPTLQRHADGSISIVCPRCGSQNEIDADVCVTCEAPFTMNAAPTLTGLQSERLGLSAVILGVVGLVFFPLVLPALIGLVCGVLAAFKATYAARVAQAVVGIVTAAVGLAGGVVFWVVMLT